MMSVYEQAIRHYVTENEYELKSMKCILRNIQSEQFLVETADTFFLLETSMHVNSEGRYMLTKVLLKKEKIETESVVDAIAAFLEWQKSTFVGPVDDFEPLMRYFRD